LGHPLWATLASLLVGIVVLLPVMLALRLPLPSLAFISKAPLWMWAGGAFGVCFISLALMLLPKLGASGFIAFGAGGTGDCLAAGSLRVVWVGGAGDDSASGVWGGVVNGWSGVDSVRRHIGKSDNSNVLIVPTLCVGM
jgi:Uncharacterized protein conserved in bacteria